MTLTSLKFRNLLPDLTMNLADIYLFKVKCQLDFYC